MADNYTVLISDGTTVKTKAATDEGSGILADRIGAGEAHIGEVGGRSIVATVNINRPADTTAYASGDLVANNVTAGSVVTPIMTVARKNGGTGVLRRIRLHTNKSGLAGTEAFRVHLFRGSATLIAPLAGDNAAFSPSGVLQVNSTSPYLGFADIVLSSVFTDGAKGFASVDIVFDTAGSVMTMAALLEVRGAYTPNSGEIFTITAEVLAD